MLITDSTEINSKEELEEAFNKDGVRIGYNIVVLNLETLIELEQVYLNYYFESNARLDELDELERLHKYAVELTWEKDVYDN